MKNSLGGVILQEKPNVKVGPFLVAFLSEGFMMLQHQLHFGRARMDGSLISRDDLYCCVAAVGRCRRSRRSQGCLEGGRNPANPIPSILHRSCPLAVSHVSQAFVVCARILQRSFTFVVPFRGQETMVRHSHVRASRYWEIIPCKGESSSSLWSALTMASLFYVRIIMQIG